MAKAVAMKWRGQMSMLMAKHVAKPFRSLPAGGEQTGAKLFRSQWRRSQRRSRNFHSSQLRSILMMSIISLMTSMSAILLVVLRPKRSIASRPDPRPRDESKELVRKPQFSSRRRSSQDITFLV